MEKHILYISEKLLPFNMLQLFSVVASYHGKIFVANIKKKSPICPTVGADLH